MSHCPHCEKKIPGKLFWKSIFAGQTAHRCPACGQLFRLTYSSKMRVAFLNLILILGLLVAWNLPGMARNMAVYGGILAFVLLILPSQVNYEKTSEADH
jgi:CXXC-20-CXXC protein